MLWLGVDGKELKAKVPLILAHLPGPFTVSTNTVLLGNWYLSGSSYSKFPSLTTLPFNTLTLGHIPLSYR